MHDGYNIDVLELLPEMMLVVSDEGLIVNSNRAFRERTQLEQAALVGSALASHVESDASELKEFLFNSSRTNQRMLGSLNLKYGNGEFLHCKVEAWTLSPGREAQPATIMLRLLDGGFALDPFVALNLRIEHLEHEIRERKRAQEDLRLSERRYRAIGEAIDYGVWITDLHGHNSYISSSFAKLIGAPEQRGYPNWVERVHPDERDLLVEKWKQCVAAGDDWDVEMRVLGVDGAWHPVLCRGVPIRNDRGEITSWAGFNLDIHKIKEAEAELMEANRRKDVFMATLAHELRNPLSPILHALDIMDEIGEQEGSAEYVAMIRRQVLYMARLMDDLLDMNRIALGKFELQRALINIISVVEQAVEASEAQIRNNDHKLIVRSSDVPILVDGDLVRLVQVVANLLINAAKYTPSGGTINLSLSEADDRVRIVVEDNGIGIPQDQLAAIFELFTQLGSSKNAPSQGGLGIGLSLVKRIVDMHGGSIQALSEGLGSGSRFILELPIATSSVPVTISDGTKPSATRASRRILVVDDNEDAANTLAFLLSKSGNTVHVVFDGQQALKSMSEFLPEVVLMDIGMPGLSGHETCRHMRQCAEGKNIQILAMSGWGQQEDKQRSYDAGFDLHLVIPFAITELMDHLAAVLDRAKE